MPNRSRHATSSAEREHFTTHYVDGSRLCRGVDLAEISQCLGELVGGTFSQ